MWRKHKTLDSGNCVWKCPECGRFVVTANRRPPKYSCSHIDLIVDLSINLYALNNLIPNNIRQDFRAKMDYLITSLTECDNCKAFPHIGKLYNIRHNPDNRACNMGYIERNLVTPDNKPICLDCACNIIEGRL